MNNPGTLPADKRAALVRSALKSAYPVPPAGTMFDDLLTALDCAGQGDNKVAGAPPCAPERPRKRWFGRV